MADVTHLKPRRVGPSEALPLRMAGVLCDVSLVAQAAKFTASVVPTADGAVARSATFLASHAAGRSVNRSPTSRR
jgi:hypothetical protein